MKQKIVYVLQSSGEESKPSVFIESLKGGEITFGIKVSAKSLAVARDRAQREFKGLTAFVRAMESAARKAYVDRIDEELRRNRVKP